jgi:hypothetical protein
MITLVALSAQRSVQVAVLILSIIVFVAFLSADSFDIRRTALTLQTDTIAIAAPERAQLFYGTLDALPHTYTFSVHEAMPFHAHILIPSGAPQIVSAILVREPEAKGRVIEIARLRATDATWSMARLSGTYDAYTEGPSFDASLEPGRYRLEVHTPNNIEPYLLFVGNEMERTQGYFAFVSALVQLKQFLGVSVLTLIISPYIYGPLYFLALAGCALYLWYTRWRGV